MPNQLFNLGQNPQPEVFYWSISGTFVGDMIHHPKKFLFRISV